MARILVVEDDPSNRDRIRAQLAGAGHEIVDAGDGEAALTAAMQERFDLVLSDTRMPRVDGFTLLTTLRGNPDTQSLPFIFMACPDERDAFRTAMKRGADDFLIKPIEASELLESVEARLARSRSLQEQGGRTVLNATVRVRAIDGDPPTLSLADKIPTAPHAVVASDERKVLSSETRSGTVLHVSVRNGVAMARGFGAQERKSILQQFFSALCEPILAQHGWVVRHNARELVAVFESTNDTAPGHAARALRAALLSVLGVHKFRQELQTRTRGMTLLDFSIGAALDVGSFELVTLEGPYGRELALAGRVAESLIGVDASVGRSGWSIAATELALQTASEPFTVGRSAALASAPGAMPLMLMEVIGFGPHLAERSGFAPVAGAVQEAVRVNSALADAPPADAGTVPGLARADTGSGIVNELAGIAGYNVLRKLGVGGMSRVYLALHLESGAEHVLKVVPFNDDDEEMLQRFIQEYALIAQVRHPNVARIYGQGFAESCAYIAMEYLAGGDLRVRIDDGIGYGDAIRYLAQSALALTAIHERGIIHRDLKPENLMLRADGTLVLADFGIAKQLSTALTRTRHGEVYGTPFYMSPEQARGELLDGRSDLYALGVIFHEMLTGAKPFTATRAEALVYQHLHSDIPVLPGRFWRVQPIVDRLLAKDPAERYGSAAELLAALDEVGEAKSATAAVMST